MATERDERELQDLEAEFGKLFAETSEIPTPRQVVVMRQRAESIAARSGLKNWWHSLRWMGAGAAVAAAALLALALFQPPIKTVGPMVANHDSRHGDILLLTAQEVVLQAGYLAVEESLADDYWSAEESEWASATSFDLLYGPMPGDDAEEWDGLYDHLLAQNMADDNGF